MNCHQLKSKNSYFNKEISKLQSIRMKQTGSKKFRNTKKINQLRIKRKNYIINYLHKASGKIIEYKAKIEGIELITVNEAYTSGCTKAYNLNYAL